MGLRKPPQGEYPPHKFFQDPAQKSIYIDLQPGREQDDTLRVGINIWVEVLSSELIFPFCQP